jgi:DNA-binding transcriptional LysR family regulator
MTLRHFKILIAVCDNMNMTVAAQTLYISQSAVSQTISELEKHYNIKLFERLGKKLYLTAAGKKLLGFARHMISLDFAAENEMRELQDNGYLRIGSSITIGAYVLPKLISKYSELYPKTKIEAFIDNTAKIQAMILSDKIDIALVEGEITSNEIYQIPFMDDELVLICNKSHKFTKCKSVCANEFEKENFIIREQGSGTRRIFEAIMSANNIIWHQIWTCNNADAIKMAVIEGIGISVISKRAIKQEVKNGDIMVIPISGLQFKRNFKIVYHINKFISPCMKELINLCHDFKI